MITFKRKSKEYRQYIQKVIDEYNSNGKKTLLFACDNAYPVVDGVWRVLESCTEILLRDYPQYNVLILAPDYRGMVYINKVPILSVRSVYVDSLHYQCALPMFDCRMKKLIKRLKIDFIHCHSPFLCGRFALKIHKKRHIPMVTTFHSQFKRDMAKATKSKLLTKFGMAFIMKVFKQSTVVWTMHTASRDTLYSYGYKGSCLLMPNATPLKPLPNYEEVRQNFRREHNLEGKIAFIFVGRLITQKGILFIVDVLQKLRERGIDFVMYFVGDGPDASILREKVAKANLQDAVKFEGNILEAENLSGYYAGADMFLFPSLYDVSSIVQIEAATYKTPTVFAEGSVTSCTVTDNVNGYLLPYDVEKYADGVEKIIKSGTAKQVGENALRDLHVEWEQVVKQCSQNYDSLMNKSVATKVK